MVDGLCAHNGNSVIAGRTMASYGPDERASFDNRDCTSYASPRPSSRPARPRPRSRARRRCTARSASRCGAPSSSVGGARPAAAFLASDGGELGVARGTVLQAMDQLVAEGYVVAQAGWGLSVAANLPDQMLTSRAAPLAPPTSVGPPPYLSARTPPTLHQAIPTFGFDGSPLAFPTGQPDRAAFPFALWAKLLEREWRKPSWSIAGAPHPFGHPGLRDAIAAYLVAARGSSCRAAPSWSPPACVRVSPCWVGGSSMRVRRHGSRNRVTSAHARRWPRPGSRRCPSRSTGRVSVQHASKRRQRRGLRSWLDAPVPARHGTESATPA